MRLLLATAVILDVLMIGLTVLLFALGNPGAPAVLAVTVAAIAVLLVFVPIAARRGRL